MVEELEGVDLTLAVMNTRLCRIRRVPSTEAHPLPFRKELKP